MKALIERLRNTASKGVSVWGDLQTEAAKEIENLCDELKAAYALVDKLKQELEAARRVINLALKELNTANSVSDMAGEFDFVISKLHAAAGAAQKEPEV